MLPERKRKRIGDILEIPLSKGFAYAHYVNEHQTSTALGSLIRVFPGIYPKKLEDPCSLVSQREKYYAYVPLARSLTLGLLSIVGSAEVPLRCRKFPTTKRWVSREFNPNNPKTWFVVHFDDEGNRTTTMHRSLPKKYYGVTMDEIVTIPFLVNLIEDGWTPESEV